MEYDISLDVSALAKAYKLRYEEDDENTLSRLLSYISLMHRVFGTECFILFNIKQFYSENELLDFYSNLAYEHVYTLDIEGSYSYKLPDEFCVIIDNDECLITID